MAKDKKKRTVYLCPKCDKEYFSMGRKDWERDIQTADNTARVAKLAHKCPWELRKLKRKGGK